MLFESLIQFLQAFPDETTCEQYLINKHWKGCVTSPYVPGGKAYRLKSGRYKCAKTQKLFSIRTGTIFQDSKISLRDWYIAIYIFSAHKKGISSYQLGRDLGITQKSTWFMLHRIRYAFNSALDKPLLSGIVESDETYIGGKEKNKRLSKQLNAYEKADKIHAKKRGRQLEGGKQVVLGLIERNGQVIPVHINSASERNILPVINQNVKPGTRMITDEWGSYAKLAEKGFTHDTIQHNLKIYVKGDIHTNTIENFWSVLKRGINGTYHQISRTHLQAYLNEFSYRFNQRDLSQNHRFSLSLQHKGKLSYKTLTDNDRPKQRHTRKKFRKPQGQVTEGNSGTL